MVFRTGSFRLHPWRYLLPIVEVVGRSSSAVGWRNLAALLLIAAGLGACVGRDEPSIGTAGNPLVVLLSPAHAPAKVTNRCSLAFDAPAAASVNNPWDFPPLRMLQRGLSSRSGLDVYVCVADSPVDAIERLGTRKADAGILTLDEFLLAREEYGVEEGLQVLRGNGAPQYESVILVKAQSLAQKAADLDGEEFGFVDPYSVSGFLLPAQFLRKEGVKVEPRFLGSHDKALEALEKGEVAAIATFGGQGAGKKNLRVLAVAGVVPNEPFVFRKGLQPEKRRALEAALRAVASDPEAQQALLALAGISGFGPVDEKAYRSVHDLLKAAGSSVYDIVPDGSEIKHLNQPYIDMR
jgi:phosphate/phosphite/phosphonate ABC transporter binding protein